MEIMNFHILEGDAPVIVVYYYFIMWFLNASGYLIGTIGCYKMSTILPISKTARVYRRMSMILAIFFSIRFLSGVDALVRFYSAVRSTTETVEFLGVVSLFLNTSFICLFGITMVMEYYRMKRMDSKKREVIAKTILAMEDLKMTTEAVQDFVTEKARNGVI